MQCLMISQIKDPVHKVEQNELQQNDTGYTFEWSLKFVCIWCIFGCDQQVLVHEMNTNFNREQQY